jgi:hypothetical protein
MEDVFRGRLNPGGVPLRNVVVLTLLVPLTIVVIHSRDPKSRINPDSFVLDPFVLVP